MNISHKLSMLTHQLYCILLQLYYLCITSTVYNIYKTGGLVKLENGFYEFFPVPHSFPNFISILFYFQLAGKCFEIFCAVSTVKKIFSSGLPVKSSKRKLTQMLLKRKPDLYMRTTSQYSRPKR